MPSLVAVNNYVHIVLCKQSSAGNGKTVTLYNNYGLVRFDFINFFHQTISFYQCNNHFLIMLNIIIGQLAAFAIFELFLDLLGKIQFQEPRSSLP